MEATALRHSKELTCLKPSRRTFSPISLFNFLDFNINFILSHFNVQRCVWDFMNKIVFPNSHFDSPHVLHFICFVECILFPVVRWGDLPMFLEIKLIIIIYYEIYSMKYLFFYLKPKIIWTSKVALVPILFTIMFRGFYLIIWRSFNNRIN